MKAGKNIVQLYFDNGKRVPFIVRRDNWSGDYALLVTSVRPRRTPTGWYGSVQGFALPPLNGESAAERWGRTGEPIEVNCSGCYQWQLIEQAPREWMGYLPETA